MSPLENMKYHKRLLNDALGKLNTLESVSAVLPPGTAADKILDKLLSDYATSLRTIVEMCMEIADIKLPREQSKIIAA